MTKELQTVEEKNELGTVEIGATTLDVESTSGKVSMFNAMQGGAKQLSTVIGEELKLKDYLVHSAEYTNDETGEVEMGLRTVIYTDKGTFATSSDVIAETIQKIVDFIGLEELRSGNVKIKVNEVRSQNGRTYQALEAVESFTDVIDA